MTRRALHIQTTFDCTGVVILDALSPSELQTARYLYDDLLHLQRPPGQHFARLVPINSAAQLRTILTDIEAECRKGLRPIIHFEAHGDDVLGLQIRSTGEWISWHQLHQWLTEINASTRNHLGVVMAVCYGRYLLAEVDIEQRCPYYFLVAAHDEVPAGYVRDKMILVYSTLFNTRSMDQALGHLDKHFQTFHAEKFFCLAFGQFMIQSSSSRGSSALAETFLSRAVNERRVRTREQRRQLRKRFKQLLRNPHTQFYSMARRFLHGRRTVTYEELKVFISARAA